MHPIVPLMMLMSVLFPARTWVAVNQPVNVQVRSAGDVTLTLTDFYGKIIDPPGGEGSADVPAGTTVDLHKMFLPVFAQTNAYLVWAVPKGKELKDFQGTPLVMEIRANVGADAMPGPTVVHIEPLVYAALDTDQGPVSLGFYFDSAPITVDHFLKLTDDGFYDGLTFHRIVPGFIIQGGDPRGDGTGGPGYMINAEFSDRLHLAGSVSMARETDPMERDGAAPRPEYANSGGSQFFISLDHARTEALDHHYTVFATVVRGMDTVTKIATLPLAGPMQTTPKTPPVIRSIKLHAVTPLDNPYAAMLRLPATPEPSTQPATMPVTEASTETSTSPSTEPATTSATEPAVVPPLDLTPRSATTTSSDTSMRDTPATTPSTQPTDSVR